MRELTPGIPTQLCRKICGKVGLSPHEYRGKGNYRLIRLPLSPLDLTRQLTKPQKFPTISKKPL